MSTLVEEFLSQVDPEVRMKVPSYVKLVDASEPIAPTASIGAWIGIANDLDAGRVMAICATSGLRHIIQMDSPNRSRDLSIAIVMIENSHLFTNDPVTLLFKGSQTFNRANVLTIPFEETSQKIKVTGDLLAFLEKAHHGKQALNSAALIIDELFTNALFSGPLGLGGNKKFAHLPRKDGVRLEDKASPDLTCAFDEEWAAIICSDPFGSLSPKTLVEHISACYTKGLDASIRSGSAGAGIGSWLIFENAARLYIGVDKYNKTVVATLLPLSRKERKNVLEHKNLHYCVFNERVGENG